MAKRLADGAPLGATATPAALTAAFWRTITELAGLPRGAGGCFVSGGSAGNLSALAVARAGGPHAVAGGETAWMAVADTAYSSVANALDLLGRMPRN